MCTHTIDAMNREVVERERTPKYCLAMTLDIEIFDTANRVSSDFKCELRKDTEH